MKKRKHLILEFTEFNVLRANPDSAAISVHVDNPQLSINAFDRHEDAIRAATSKLNGLLNTLTNSAQFGALKSRLALEEQNITSMKILRIAPSNNINYNIFVQFVIKDEEYWGVAQNILDDEPTFKSEVFKDTDLVLTKEWILKIKGLIIKILKNWLNPDNGVYKLINDECQAINVDTGEFVKLSKDTKVEVIRAFDNKIVIKLNSKYYNLTGDNYIYFNYWFIKIS
jgi:hypothetical protein